MLISATLVFVSWFIKHFWQLFIGILWASIVSVSWIVNIKLQSFLFQNNKGNGVIIGDESWVSVHSLSEYNCQSVALWIMVVWGCAWNSDRLAAAGWNSPIKRLLSQFPASTAWWTVPFRWHGCLMDACISPGSNLHVEEKGLFWFSLICWTENCSSWESDWQISLTSPLCVGSGG